MIVRITAYIAQLNSTLSRVLLLLTVASAFVLAAVQLTSANPAATASEAVPAVAVAALPAPAASTTAPAMALPPASTTAPVMAAPAVDPALVVPAEVYIVPLPFDPPADRIADHPLEWSIAAIRTGKSTETRNWVLPLLVKALSVPMRQARITGYSSRDSDGGGPYTRWGTRTRWGLCAADPRYWGPGSVIWMGDPVNQVLVVEDTGGAIKGPDRFDVCTGDDPVSSSRIGSRHANYVPLYRAEPRRSWGGKPSNWSPPLPAECRQGQ